MLDKQVRCLVILVLVPLVCSVPLNHDIERGPLAAVSDLSSRVASRAGLLQGDGEPRLPLPSPQDLETIRKVAQILVMLGDQVLPTIGERPSKQPPACDPPAQEVPNDPVNDK